MAVGRPEGRDYSFGGLADFAIEITGWADEAKGVIAGGSWDPASRSTRTPSVAGQGKGAVLHERHARLVSRMFTLWAKKIE
jgi:hypothetical protein